MNTNDSASREISNEAYTKVVNSGLLRTKQKAAFRVVFHGGPGTAAELREWARRNFTIEQDSLHKRLSELKAMGVVRSLPARVCRVTGYKATVWEVTGQTPVEPEKKPVLSRNVLLKRMDEAALLLVEAVTSEDGLDGSKLPKWANDRANEICPPGPEV